MPYVIELPTKPSLKPDAEAARRLAQRLRELHASQKIIKVAEQTVEAVEKANNAPVALNQRD